VRAQSRISRRVSAGESICGLVVLAPEAMASPADLGANLLPPPLSVNQTASTMTNRAGDMPSLTLSFSHAGERGRVAGRFCFVLRLCALA